jgi:hypothetical protein
MSCVRGCTPRAPRFTPPLTGTQLQPQAHNTTGHQARKYATSRGKAAGAASMGMGGMEGWMEGAEGGDHHQPPLPVTPA